MTSVSPVMLQHFEKFMKSPVEVQEESPGRTSFGQVPRKPVIFCKLYYNDII